MPPPPPPPFELAPPSHLRKLNKRPGANSSIYGKPWVDTEVHCRPCFSAMSDVYYMHMLFKKQEMFSVFAQSYINTRRCWENSKQLYVTTANSPNPQVCMLWCNFILGSNFIFLCFKLIFIYCHTPKQRKTKFKPRKKFNHKTYTFKISRHTPVNSKPMSNSCFHDQLTSQLFTYSHANTPLGESESVHCLSYFMKLYCIHQWCYFHGKHMSVCLCFFF